MPSNSDYIKSVAYHLCDPSTQLKFVLSALTVAVQERLGEDVILWPRKRIGSIAESARVYTCKFSWQKREVVQHIIFYEVPEGDRPHQRELLRVTLDIAHELGHLLLDRGPGHMPVRVGISENDLKTISEIEADWFALCVLQMYGFIFPPE